MTTLRDLINQVPERQVKPTENPAMTARLPGDSVEDHPLMASQVSNPFYGTSPLKVLLLLKAGKFTPTQERQARSYLDQYSKLSGDKLTMGR